MVIFNSEKQKLENYLGYFEKGLPYVSLLKITGLQLFRFRHIWHVLLGLAKKSDAYCMCTWTWDFTNTYRLHTLLDKPQSSTRHFWLAAPLPHPQNHHWLCISRACGPLNSSQLIAFKMSSVASNVASSFILSHQDRGYKRGQQN